MISPAVLALLACPACRGSLSITPLGTIRCASCGRVYPVRDGIPVLIEAEAQAPQVDRAGTFLKENSTLSGNTGAAPPLYIITDRLRHLRHGREREP